MLKVKLPKKTLKVLISAAIPALIILASYFRIFETYELATLDIRFRIRPPQKATDKVVFIEIAQDTLDQLGQWPISRDYHALLIDALTEYGSKAIVFDMTFGQSSPSDAAFIESVKNSRRVYVASIFRLSEKRQKKIFPEVISCESQPLPSLRDYVGTGHINAVVDRDGKRRSAPLFIDFNGKLIPQISFLALCDYLGVSIKDVKVEKARYIKMPPDIRIPIDSNGYTIVNYAGRWGEVFKHYSYVDILKAYAAKSYGKKSEISLNELRGKICLVGLTAPATHDLNPTPLEERSPMVGLHANIINTILTKNFIVRVNKFINLFILVFLSVMVILAVLRLRPARGILAALGIFFGFIITAFVLFGFLRIWVDLFYPLILISGVYIFSTFYKYITERNKRIVMERELDIAQKIQRSFLKETPPQIEGLDIAVIMTPAKSVGGDLYDFIEMKGRIGIMIGDVSGKGVPAALFMAKTVTDFRFHAKTQESSLKVMTDLNNQIAVESTSGLFVTLSYIVVDRAAKKLTIVDGGHLPAAYAGREKETTFITTAGGMALGIMEGVEFLELEVAIREGDVFVFYTDGVTEARNIKGEEFTEERLKDAVSKYKELGAKDITQKIYEDLQKFKGKASQHDDITIITMKVV